MKNEKQELEVKKNKVLISDLFNQNLNTYIPLEQLQQILSTPPPDNWVKTHPFINGYKYLPIDKVEYLLMKCFKKYNIEVIENKILFNSIAVTVRVHYLNPATNTMEFHDGVGACELQTKKDTGNLKPDMSNVNKGAVMMALPLAKTTAIKDACDHFGSLFGANLNRKDVIHYVSDKNLLSSEKIDEFFNILLSINDVEEFKQKSKKNWDFFDSEQKEKLKNKLEILNKSNYEASI